MAARKGRAPADEVALQQEEVIQAVVVADSFNTRFAPITQTKPRVLLPLVNRPLLEYTLEFLSAAGVQETILFCCAHAQQIKEFVQKSKWSQSNSSMVITTVVSDTFLSVGDVLRELDAKGMIRCDFVLLSGDVLATFPLLDVLEWHKKQRQQDKGCLMTAVFKRVSPKTKIRCLEDECIVAIEAQSERILHYQKVGDQKKITFPLTLFQDCSQVTLRYDVLDCHISICSPLVPQLFTDNFDYQDRDDFMKGVLVDEEVLGNSVYMHVVEEGYAARVSNLYMYDAISRDVINRWAYPVAPDMQQFDGGRYSYLRHNIYKQKDVELARGCILKKNVVIGQGTRIGKDAEINNSVIGRNCKIGSNVFIEGAYLWDSVEVADNCRVEMCILADGVVLKSDVTIQPGSVLSFGVVVESSTVIPRGSLLQANPPDQDDFDTEELLEKTEMSTNMVAPVGRCFSYSLPADSDEENEDTLQDKWADEQVSDDDDESSLAASSGPEDLLEGSSPIPDDTRMFYNEVLDSLLRGVEEKVKCENLVLEINSSKYAYNVTMKEVNTLVTKAILEIPQQRAQKPLTAQEYFAALKPLLEHLMPLLMNYIKSTESQEDCLSSLEEFSIANKRLAPAMMKILHSLYSSDILREESILDWYNHPPTLVDFDPAEQDVVRKQVAPFIKWLQEAEEESSDDDSA